MSACECGAAWGGSKICHCVACHETFSTERNFSAHQGAIEGCSPPGEVLTKSGDFRFKQNARGVWVEIGPLSETRPMSRMAEP